MSNSSMSRIRLTNNVDALKKLRRLGLLVKDAHGEKYTGMFNGMGIPFWVGHEKEIPTAWAEGLVHDFVMPLDEVCKQCKGQGATTNGICHVCKGTRYADTNRIAPLFKLMSTRDLSLEDPTTYHQPPAAVAESEAAKALTS